jgi:hypothetical protein
MGSAPFHLIRITIEMAIEVGAFFSVIDFLSCINVVNSLTAKGGHDRPLFDKLL